MKQGQFGVVVPHHDDWMQTRDYDLAARKVDIFLAYGQISMYFKCEEDLVAFVQWAEEAIAAAGEGCRTMWP